MAASTVLGAAVDSLERVADRQMLESADEDRRDVLRVTGQLDRLQPRHQFGEETVDLHAGQCCAEAKVNAVAERVVFVGVATDVEPEGGVEDVLVAGGRRG